MPEKSPILNRFDQLRKQCYGLRRKGRYLEAFNLANELREVARDLDSYQQAEADIAWAEACDNVDQANKLITEITERVQHYYEQIGDLSGILRCKVLKGHNCMHLGNQALAEDLFTEVIGIGTKHESEVDSPEYVIAARTNLGVMLELQGRIDESILQYQKVLEIEKSFPSDRVRLITLSNLGGLYSTVGKVRQAIECLEAAYSLSNEQQDCSSKNRVSLALGDIYYNLSQYKKARLFYNEALKAAKDAGELAPLANSLSGIAFFEATSDQFGSLDRAERTAEEAVKFANESQDPESICCSLRVQGTVYKHQKKYENAQECFVKSLELTDNPAMRHNLELQLGALALEQNLPNKAIDHYMQALNYACEVGSLDLLHRASVSLAACEIKCGKSDKAYEHLVDAANYMESYLEALGGEALSAELVSSAEQTFELLLYLFHAFRGDEEEEIIDEIFNVTDRIKGWHILNRLRRFPRLASSSGPEDLLRRERDCLQAIDELMRKPLSEDPINFPKRREKAKANLDFVLNEIKLFDPGYVLTKREPSVTIGEVRSEFLKYHDNAILAQYYISNELSFVVVNHSDWVRHYKLDVTADEVANCAKRLSILINGNPQHCIPPLAPFNPWHRDVFTELNIGKRLIPYYKDLVDAEVLYISPHRDLHHLPWSCLIPEEGRFLVDLVGVCVVPSFSIALQCRERYRWLMKRMQRESALVVGIPTKQDLRFESDFQDRTWILPILNFPTEEPLTHPSKQLLLERIQNAQLIHLACHGVLCDDQSPTVGFLIGDGVESPDLHNYCVDSEVITTKEIAETQIKARLVVARACSSGIVNVQAGDEIQGMLRAFLYSGAATTISSLWDHSVRSSRVLLKHMYSLWEKGMPIWQALRNAQLNLRDGRIDGWRSEWEHPYHWGAFKLMGYGNTKLR